MTPRPRFGGRKGRDGCEAPSCGGGWGAEEGHLGGWRGQEGPSGGGARVGVGGTTRCGGGAAATTPNHKTGPHTQNQAVSHSVTNTIGVVLV